MVAACPQTVLVMQKHMAWPSHIWSLKMILRKTFLIAIAMAATCGLAHAWEGTNTNTGSNVEIEHGELVRSGETIEVYDSNKVQRPTMLTASTAVRGAWK